MFPLTRDLMQENILFSEEIIKAYFDLLSVLRIIQ
jgi:hypothetical protein